MVALLTLVGYMAVIREDNTSGDMVAAVSHGLRKLLDDQDSNAPDTDLIQFFDEVDISGDVPEGKGDPPGTQDAMPHGLRKLPHNQDPGSVTGLRELNVIEGPIGDPIDVEDHVGGLGTL